MVGGNLARRLDQEFAGQLRSLSAGDREQIRAWQATDRRYELVQAVMRGELDLADPSAAEWDQTVTIMTTLSAAIHRGACLRPLTVYRGLRDVAKALAAPPERLVGGRIELEGFTAVSIHADIAVTDFTTVHGGLLEISVPAGTPALWVAGAGAPRLRRQGELLFDAELPARITGHRRQDELPVLSAQVVL